MTRIQSLNGAWKYCPDPAESGEAQGFQLAGFDDNAWPQMEIPSHWHLAGLDFLGKVWFRKRFTAEPAESIRLCFQAVDYSARVWLNGKFLGEHTGYFDPFAFDVTDALARGRENIIALEVDGSADPGFPFAKKFFRGGLGHWDMRPGGWSERGQEKTSAGIWQPVLLQSAGEAWFESFVPRVRKEKDRWVIDIKTRIICRAVDIKNAEISVSLEPKNFSPGKEFSFSEKLALAPGANEFSFKLEVDSPELWWTWDLGASRLYQLSAKLLKDGKVTDELENQVGFRSVDWRGDGIYLNDKRVFLRGACYLSSLWLGSMTREKILADLDLVKAAAMNCLRVCYHVEPLHFYDLADRAGILLWQDFPMLWDYDASGSSQAEAERQTRRMVRILGHHPSIFLWCCHCEPVNRSNRNMDRALAKAVADEDCAGRRIKASTHINEHPFYGWYLGTLLGFAGVPAKPLPNEFGAQSLPNMNSRLWQELKESAWPPNREWEYRNFQSELFFEMRDSSSLEQMIERSQDYQGEVLNFAIQAFRRAKGKIWGAIIFTFVDAWPSITWSIVDADRNAKASYFAVKNAFRTVKLSLDLLEDDSLPSPWMGWRAWNSHFDLGEKFSAKIWLINDLAQEIPDARLAWELSGPKGKIASAEKQATIKADSAEIAEKISLPLNDTFATGDYNLCAKLFLEGKEADSEQIHLFFGPTGTRSKNARRQLFSWLRAERAHLRWFLNTFPARFIKSMMNKLKS